MKCPNKEHFLLDLSVLGVVVARPKWWFTCINIEGVQARCNIHVAFECILNYFNSMSQFIRNSFKVMNYTYYLNLIYFTNQMALILLFFDVKLRITKYKVRLLLILILVVGQFCSSWFEMISSWFELCQMAKLLLFL